MDTVFAFARRLIVALVLVPALVWASSVPDTWCNSANRQYVNDACQGNAPGSTWIKNGTAYGCRFGMSSGYNAIFSGSSADGDPSHITYTVSALLACPPPGSDTPCKSAPRAQRWQQGKFLNGYQATITWTDPATGITAACRMHMNPLGPPMLATDGSWWTYIGVGPDDAGTPDAAPLPAGQVNDQNGAPAPQVPKNFPSDGGGVTPKDPPKVCGAVSCYDPKTGTACGLVNGVQMCIQGPPTPAQNGGGCAVMGDGSLCNGNPPPTPDPTKVPDPPTWTKGIDHNTFADPATGNSFNNITIVYGPPSQPASSGQQTGDMGPAPSSSTSPKPQSGYGDGGDCNAPPSCTGDAVMCGIARETWRNRCSAKQSADQAHKDLTGDGPPQDFDQLKTKYGQGDVWSDPDTSQDGTVGGQANKGIYDQSGFGFARSCPLHDLPVAMGGLGTFTIPLEPLCVVGGWLRALVIGFALFSAACITAGGRG